jgi:NAD(P)-dependent dehydrogenase (short-subunit alcohol dehydrogenase family)
MGKLEGKQVVVVGGSRGTGRAIVAALVQEGADVLAVGRNPASLAELAAAYPAVRTLQADATEAATAAQVFDGAPDVVVLAAGAVPPTQPLHELEWSAFSANWNTDVQASFLLAQHALTAPAKPGTTLILLSSGAALFGSPISGGYAGAKRMQMFVANYAQDASRRLGRGLRFLAVAPWRLMHGTGTGEVVLPGYGAYSGLGEAGFAATMTRAQTKEQVAEAVLAFCAQAPAPEKGNVFVVSGTGVVSETEVPQALLG